MPYKEKKPLSERFKELSITKLVFVILLAIIILQVLALILEKWIPSASSVKFGPLFVMFGVVISILGAFYFIFHREQAIQRPDIIIIIVLVGVILFLTIFLKQLLPEIFKPSMASLINIFGG